VNLVAPVPRKVRKYFHHCYRGKEDFLAKIVRQRAILEGRSKVMKAISVEIYERRHAGEVYVGTAAALSLGSHTRFVLGQSIRQRSPGIATQNKCFCVPRVR